MQIEPTDPLDATTSAAIRLTTSPQHAGFFYNAPMVASSKDQAREFAALLEQYEPEIRRAFLASVTDISANVDWPALIAALEAYDIESAIAALNIDSAAFAEYSSAMTQTYAAAGASTAAQVAQIGVRFNMSNPSAQEWIAQNVGERITGFVQEQVQAARDLIGEGYAKGMGPRQIGLDLAGRVVNGKREGGILGLDTPRAERYQRVVEGMRTADGVKNLVIEHADGSLSLRYKVNKATGDRILKAYRNGTAVSESDQRISERQYKNALLKARADTIARTETASAVMNARYEQWRQLAELQGLNASAVVKTWVHTAGGKGDFRPSHLAMNGKSVRGLDTPFMVDGVAMKYPQDPAGGAANNISCRCSCTFRIIREVA